ncbi:MAG: hypothetical protein AB1679_28685 [Actinomycetota bacterium]|jgi:hypothetical protein
MALDERSRHRLFLRLEEALGPEAATTLMEHLPPTGWADVATKRDLDALEQRLTLRIENVELRIEASEHKLMATFRGELQSALTAQSRQVAISLAGTAGALSALAFAAARLT